MQFLLSRNVHNRFFGEKCFYGDNLLLSVLAKSCKESAVAELAVVEAYTISLFDLLHLNRIYSGTIYY